MAVTVYASVAEFTARLPQTAWGARTVADVQTANADASSLMDDFFRGVYPLPFSRVGRSVSIQCVNISRNLFLGGRGFSPVSGADEDIISGLKWAEDWLDRVQRRVLFPDVTVDASATTSLPVGHGPFEQPIATSLPSRGWVGPGRGPL